MKKIAYIILTCFLTACDSLIEVDYPPDELTSDIIFENDASAISAIRGIYADFAGMPYFSNGGIAMLTGLSGDELMPMSEEYAAFYHAALKPDDAVLMDYLWRPAYSAIYSANAVLEGVSHSNGVTQAVREQLAGEALFIRAFSHFYLTNLFGPVPLLTEKDFEKNALATRTAPDVVYDTIEADLIKARHLLSDSLFTFTSNEPGRIRPTSWAASALLARVYLYQENWTRAEQEASRVIEYNDLFSLATIEEVFKVGSREAIWQLQANTPDLGSWDALLFMPTGDWLSVALRPELMEAFEPGDRRRKIWVDSLMIGPDAFFYPAKYRSQYSQLEEYHIELRLAELYLIRAEARARLNDLPGALADLDAIRKRAGLPPLAESGQNFTVAQIIDSILHERRAEFFAEGGHRWLDLKRLDSADAVLSQLPGKVWRETDILYPIPQSEIEANRNLDPQNEGY